MKPRGPGGGRARLSDIGEDALLAKLSGVLPLTKNVIAGSGDDAAIVRGGARGDLLVLKTDCVVEGVHFDHKASPDAIGWKAMMRPLSDFAAVSGIPEFALVTLIVNRDRKVSWVSGVYRGLIRAGRRFGVSIVGGETSAAPRSASISVCVVGRVEKKRWVSRRGGKPGDQLFVTGRLGGSISGKHLRFVPRIEESRWLTANFRIHAMMDLSDGLGADLPRLAKASGVGFEIETFALPRTPGASVRNAIGDGEDYELLFAVSPRDRSVLHARWRKQFAKLPLTRIGVLTPHSALRTPQLKSGYVHFQ